LLSAYVLACLALCAVLCGAPPVIHDALACHLVLPEMYLRHGAITYEPSINTALWPSLPLMLRIPGMTVGSVESAQFLEAGFGAAILLALIRAGARGGSRRAGWAAAALLVSTPHFTRLALTAMVDMGGALFATLLVLAALRAREEREGLFWAVLAGVFGGLSFSCKLNGALWVLCAPAMWAWNKAPLRENLRRTAVLWAVAAAVSSPWWLRSWVVSGNPVWPYAWTVFGGRYWDAKQTAVFLAYGSGEIGTAGYTYWPLVLRKVVDAVDWREAVHPFRGFLYSVFGAAALWRGREVFPSEYRPLGRMLLAYLAVYFFGMPQSVRYLSPVAPWAALGIAWGLFSRLESKVWGRRIAVAAVFALAWRGSLLTEPRAREKAAVALGMRDRDAFLSSMVPGYSMESWIDKTLPGDAKVLLLTDIRGFYIHRDIIWGSPIYQKYVSYDGVKTEADLLDRWRRSGADYVLWFREPTPWPADGLEALGAFVSHTPALRVDGDYTLYDLAQASPSRVKKGI
jgi:hypothetical protein